MTNYQVSSTNKLQEKTKYGGGNYHKTSHTVWIACGSRLKLFKKKKRDNSENLNTGWIFESIKELLIFCDNGTHVYLFFKSLRYTY